MTERSLERDDLTDDPVEVFGRWFDEAVASGEAEPEAMALATADAEGVPAVRFVLLKSFDAAGFVFFTNAGSGKGRDLGANPHAALVWRWSLLDRQVRVAGTASPATDAESDAYFATRSRRSQLGAWASDQSRPLASRRDLEERLAGVAARYDGGDVPRPPHWHGWRIAPRSIEFWQGRDNRLHDRFRYLAVPGGWEIERLSP